MRPLYFVADMGLIVGRRVGSAQHRDRIQVSVTMSSCAQDFNPIRHTIYRRQGTGPPSSHPEPKPSDSPHSPHSPR